MVCDLVLSPIVLTGSISGPFLSWAPCTLAGGTYCKNFRPRQVTLTMLLAFLLVYLSVLPGYWCFGSGGIAVHI